MVILHSFVNVYQRVWWSMMVYDLPEKVTIWEYFRPSTGGFKGCGNQLQLCQAETSVVDLSLSLGCALHKISMIFGESISLHYDASSCSDLTGCVYRAIMCSAGVVFRSEKRRQHFIGTIFLSQRIGMNTYRSFLVKVKPVKPAPVWNQATDPFGSS